MDCRVKPGTDERDCGAIRLHRVDWRAPGHLPLSGVGRRLNRQTRRLQLAGERHLVYEDLAEWKDEEAANHIVLDRKHGVTVEKLGSLSYRVSFKGKSVVFDLNDLS